MRSASSFKSGAGGRITFCSHLISPLASRSCRHPPTAIPETEPAHLRQSAASADVLASLYFRVIRVVRGSSQLWNLSRSDAVGLGAQAAGLLCLAARQRLCLTIFAFTKMCVVYFIKKMISLESLCGLGNLRVSRNRMVPAKFLASWFPYEIASASTII